MPLVEQFIDSHVAVITLADQDRGNRLNLESLQALEDAVQRSLSDPHVRLLVIRSSADSFSLGMDLEALLKSEGKGIEEALDLYSDILFEIHRSPKPVVCLLNGDVKAGGVGIVCACDIVLCTERTSFEMGEVLFGLVPANVLPYLLFRRISPKKARYLILTSKKIDSGEAKALGLSDEVFREEDFEKGVREILRRLLQSSPSALAETKAFIEVLEGADLEQARALAKEEFLKLTRRPEALEAIAAYSEGSTPSWFERFKPRSPITRA